jgi:RNA polymerase sigma factor (sigma-70 family)
MDYWLAWKLLRTVNLKFSHVAYFPPFRMNLDISSVYQLYRKELINYLTRIVYCRDTAQDLVQESYLILARVSAEQVIEQPRGFLYRTANNLALDHLRHHKVVARHAELESRDEEPDSSSIEQELTKEQWLTLLRQAIGELPPRCRDAFILHKVRGLSYRETAHMLGITESAVEKHIIKGLQHCRARLGKHFSSDGFEG